jgi:hypothetical protein
MRDTSYNFSELSYKDPCIQYRQSRVEDDVAEEEERQILTPNDEQTLGICFMSTYYYSNIVISSCQGCGYQLCCGAPKRSGPPRDRLSDIGESLEQSHS